jgi:hypothetical protein
MIKGITVRLYQTNQIGTDDFNAPIYEETPVEVENILVSPVSAEDVVSDFQMYGKHSVYELCIPKGDCHDWQDKCVEFFGKSWRTFGFPKEWIEDNVPLDWNQTVKVERYG